MITHMNRGIGQLLEMLRRPRLATRSLVIFTSGNGAGNQAGIPRFAGTSALRGPKGEEYEGGLRVPKIAHWPGWVPVGESKALRHGSTARIEFYALRADPWETQDLAETSGDRGKRHCRILDRARTGSVDYPPRENV